MLTNDAALSWQAKTAQSTIVGNICFEIPRAGINLNDGGTPPPPQQATAPFNPNAILGSLCVDGLIVYVCASGLGGGTLIEQNLLFNTCGESGDHGAINTVSNSQGRPKSLNFVLPRLEPTLLLQRRRQLPMRETADEAHVSVASRTQALCWRLLQWDRQAYLTTVATGEPSYRPAENEIHHNFIVSDGDADGGAVDNDDGSSFYNIHHNFCIYGE